MNEIWKDIYGYEKYYQISNLGRIRSKDRLIQNGNSFSYLKKGKLLKPISNSKGYLRVWLKCNGHSKNVFIHRLVAMQFVENPLNYPVVNHLDCNPKNNFASNLEWTTLKGNSQYSIKFGNSHRTPEWKSNLKKTLDIVMATPVIGTNILTGETIFFKAINDTKAAGFQPSCVCNCCKEIRYAHKGYSWRYA